MRRSVPALLSVMVVLSGCQGDSVGIVPDPDASASDSTVADPDAEVTLPDASAEVTHLGWRSEAFEHSGFVLVEHVDPARLESCDPYLTALPGEETWWTGGAAYDGLLALFPHPGGTARISLIEATGHLSEPGTYGHMGGYQREFQISSYDVRVCPTVEALGHCVVPGPSDFCQFPAPETYEERETHTVRELPGPAGAPYSYHVTVTYDPNVGDGTTVFHARFSLPPDEAPAGPDWEVFEVGDAALGGLGLREERLWFYYEEVRYPNQLSGWVLRHRTEDLLRISLYGEAGETGGSLHLWGDFPIDETVAHP
jgi:hypothetical protein